MREVIASQPMQKSKLLKTSRKKCATLSTIMRQLKPKLRKIMPVKRTTSYLMEERSSLEMKDLGPQRFCSLLEKPGSSNWMEFISTAMPLCKNVMLMLGKISFKISSYQEVQLYSMVWERECGKKSINWPLAPTKSKYWPHQRGNSVFGLEVPFWLHSVLSRQCG